MLRKLLLSLLLVFSCQWAIAQVKQVSGTVTSEEPLPGVAVIEKGTANGTVTDMNGNYRLNLQSAKPILVISGMGMVSREILVTGTSMNIGLKPSSETLEEVVVTALGQERSKGPLAMG